MGIDRCCTGLLVGLLACAAATPRLDAKEPPKTYGGFTVNFTLDGGALYQAIEGKDIAVRMPAYLKNEIQSSSQADLLPDLKAGRLTDNPLPHGAAYAHAALDARNAGLTLFCELIAEHRGASYGVYSMENVAFLPKLLASVDTSFAVGDERFRVGGSAGNYDDYRLYEGLTIYNVDVQGRGLYLEWRRLRATYSMIADLDQGIGLEIGDQFDYEMSLEGLRLWKRLTLDAGAGYVEYGGGSVPDAGLRDDGWNASAALSWGEKIRLYSQVGIRNVVDSRYGGLERSADLVGCSYRGALGKLDLDLTGEYRYYGRYFNQGFHSRGSCFLYRGIDEAEGGCLNWNSVGEFLYPLDLYYRPFSQWAVYTDYQGRDAQTLIGRADASYALPAGCSLFCNLDFNYLDVSNEDPFLYPFYSAGFGWSPASGVTLSASHTNRGMNLDRHYPTLYLLETGVFMFSLRGAILF